MPVVSYHTTNGRVSATSVGSDPTRKGAEMLPDALGSVVRTANDGTSNGRVTRYSPHGRTLSVTGGWALPRNGWVGGPGYRSTQMKHAEQYVRARHLSSASARWTSVDPLWPNEAAFGYVEGNPIRNIDPSGLKIVEVGDIKAGGSLSPCCGDFLRELYRGDDVKTGAMDQILKCMASKGFNDVEYVKAALANFKNLCGTSDGSPNICVAAGYKVPVPQYCNPCSIAGAGMTTYQPLPNPTIPAPPPCPVYKPYADNPCAPLFSGSKCDCQVFNCFEWPSRGSRCQAIFHESIHCGGVGAPPGHGNYKPGRPTDIIYALGCCTCEAIYGKNSVDCLANCAGWTKK